MKKLFFVMVALMMMASLLATTVSAAPAALLTPTPELGQLKVCKVAGSGVVEGTLFTFQVNGSSYNVPAGPADRNGYCVLAGQYPVGMNVTVEEVIPSGYYVSRIEVKPDRTVNRDIAQGIVTVQIVSGVIEAIFTNKVAGPPTPTRTPTSIHTSTPRPTNTPPGCGDNCTATPTPIPVGRLQICKEAEGSGVTGSFNFRFGTRSRSVPVGACAGLIAVQAGTLTISEDAQTGFSVADIYTIPADRLISKNIAAGTANVRIIEGTAISQTIVIFRNRAVSITSTFTHTPTFTATATATSTATGSQTATNTATPTGSITPTATFTPTGSVTPTFTPTPTGPTPVCPPITVFADFSQLELGHSVEGMGRVAPYLDINARFTAVRIEEGKDPFQYRATGSGTPIVNGGIAPSGGFADPSARAAGQPDLYEFTFAPGITVNEFSLRMLDFGDFNPREETNHSVILTAYNAVGSPVASQDLTFTTDAERLPDNSPQYGNLQITGDALSAQDGQPGKWTWRVTGDGIVRVVLEFSAIGHDPHFGFDSLSYTTEVCPVCQPFNVAAFSQIPVETPIEGFGVLAPYFSINAKGTAVKIEEVNGPFQYRAGLPPVVNGGIGPNGGFGDSDTQLAGQAHRYTFSFALGISVREFSLRMLDHGDLNPQLATNHSIIMKAYNSAGAVVATQDLSYTTDAEGLPDNSPEWNNLQITGDGLRAQDGEPGRWTWRVTGNDIVKVVLDFPVGHDPNIGFDSLSFTCQ
jgi:hypothetical protein